MKIAVPTDDGKTITPHFGRAQSFAIFEVENGEIISKQIVDSNTAHGSHEAGHQDANDKHDRFKAVLGDCEAIIAAGMGNRAVTYFQAAGIKPVFTDVTDAEEAVKAYSQGRLQECTQPDCGRH